MWHASVRGIIKFQTTFKSSCSFYFVPIKNLPLGNTCTTCNIVISTSHKHTTRYLPACKWRRLVSVEQISDERYGGQSGMCSRSKQQQTRNIHGSMVMRQWIAFQLQTNAITWRWTRARWLTLAHSRMHSRQKSWSHDSGVPTSWSLSVARQMGQTCFSSPSSSLEFPRSCK